MSSPWAMLLRPAALAAVGLLVLNDHVFKALAPGLVSGKLSDFAGLFYFPLLAAAAVLAARPSFPRRRVLAFSAVCTGALFALAKTAPGAHEAFAWLGLSVVRDPTDLVALAVLPFSVVYGARAETASARFTAWLATRRLPRAACLLLVVAATAATAPPQPRGGRRYPAWQAPVRSREIGGTIVQAWVSRSGRSGLGVSVDLDASAAAATASVALDPENTHLSHGAAKMAPAHVVAARAVPGTRARGYLAFELDGLAAWNDGPRTATLRLGLLVDDAKRSLVLPLVFDRPGPHGFSEGEVDLRDRKTEP